jgi:hypothetical protein
MSNEELRNAVMDPTQLEASLRRFDTALRENNTAAAVARGSVHMSEREHLFERDAELVMRAGWTFLTLVRDATDRSAAAVPKPSPPLEAIATLKTSIEGVEIPFHLHGPIRESLSELESFVKAVSR